MKNAITYFIILVVMIFSSCENDPITWDNSDKFVGFAVPSVIVPENGTNDVKVMIAGLENSNEVTVNYEISTTGITNPAILGVDYNVNTTGSVAITNGAGFGIITVSPVDNDIYTGDKSFYVTITTNSDNIPNGREIRTLVVIKDDEHPLKKWIGTYAVHAASYINPGPWDEDWTIVTAADPIDVTKLKISGFLAQSTAVVEGIIDLDEMTITIPPNQAIYSTTYFVFLGTEDGALSEEDIVGTISDDGSIAIDHFGVSKKPLTEANLYDVFNTTWVKQ